MKIHQVIGAFLLVLLVSTFVGMGLKSQAYWDVYNNATIVFCVLGAVALFRQK